MNGPTLRRDPEWRAASDVDSRSALRTQVAHWRAPKKEGSQQTLTISGPLLKGLIIDLAMRGPTWLRVLTLNQNIDSY